MYSSKDLVKEVKELRIVSRKTNISRYTTDYWDNEIIRDRIERCVKGKINTKFRGAQPPGAVETAEIWLAILLSAFGGLSPGENRKQEYQFSVEHHERTCTEGQRNLSCVTVDVSRRSQSQFPQPPLIRVFCVDEREDLSGSENDEDEDEDEEHVFCRTEAREFADEYLAGEARQENLAFILAGAHLMSIAAWKINAQNERVSVPLRNRGRMITFA
ncbi:hypothetical protein BP00DRAFT_447902 [Aspergillus indologenus CBS 114.80]|uniref:Uncharacterized protein n=1 Tax=Aspergillus indologenus CBS 114.80 TaxID=1450541 RepID=A0A2V5IN21_9EURO|nr:hypothetical protein BP00DRAFT_447902 [Aspergillus indologenus CBS 114.80]